MPPHPGPLPASGAREIIDARARARTALPEPAACEKSRLAAAEAFELGGGPGDRLIDRLALDGALRDHFCCRRLRVNLVGDAGRPRARGAAHPHLSPRPVAWDTPPGRGTTRP